MKKTFVSLFLVLVLAASLFSFSAFAENDHLLHVTGSASVTLPADTAVVQIGVETQDEDMAAAQRKNNILMDSVIDALSKAGMPKEDMTTSNFNVYSYTNDGITYYNISNTLQVTVKDLSQIGMIMDTAVKAGANQMYGLSFSSSQSREAYKRALKRAVEDAQEKAAVLSDAAGVKLGSLLSIDAREMTPVYGVSNTYEAEGKGADTTILSGDVAVNAAVILTFEIQ